MSQTLITKLHARLDLERAVIGRGPVHVAEYPARIRTLHTASTIVSDTLASNQDALAVMASTRLVDAMGIDLAKGPVRPAVSVVSNYLQSIRDDSSKMAAWFWLCFIDDVLHHPYANDCTGVYVDALHHLQPVGIMAMIHAFNRMTYHVNVHEQRRIVDEVVVADRVLRM
jgi:hypothetical protein